MSDENQDRIIGGNIQALRKRLDLSQAELAEKLTRSSGTNYHQQTILRIEKGERPLKVSEAIAFAKVFDVPVPTIWNGFTGDSDSAAIIEQLKNRAATKSREMRTNAEELQRALIELAEAIHIHGDNLPREALEAAKDWVATDWGNTITADMRNILRAEHGELPNLEEDDFLALFAGQFAAHPEADND